jgi:hypothetical protein
MKSQRRSVFFSIIGLFSVIFLPFSLLKSTPFFPLPNNRSVYASPFTPVVTSAFLDDFDDPTINSNAWQKVSVGNGPALAAINENIQVDIPAASSGSFFEAGLKSSFRIKGDFDIQLDFNLPVWPAKNGVRIGLAANAPSEFSVKGFLLAQSKAG